MDALKLIEDTIVELNDQKYQKQYIEFLRALEVVLKRLVETRFILDDIPIKSIEIRNINNNVNEMLAQFTKMSMFGTDDEVVKSTNRPRTKRKKPQPF